MSTITWAPTDPQSEAALYAGVSSIPDFAVAVSPFCDLNMSGLSPAALRLITAGVAPPITGLSQATAFAIASPITRVRPDIPPLLVIHGRNDTMVPVAQSQALNREMLFLSGGHMRLILTSGKHVFGGYSPATLRPVLRVIGDCAVGSPGSVCEARNGTKAL